MIEFIGRFSVRFVDINSIAKDESIDWKAIAFSFFLDAVLLRTFLEENE